MPAVPLTTASCHHDVQPPWASPPSGGADPQPQGCSPPRCRLSQAKKAPLQAGPRAQSWRLPPCPSSCGASSGATLPPCLQEAAAERWPRTPQVQGWRGGGQQQLCPPRQALSHGKVPAESGTAEPGSSFRSSLTAWGRLRGAGRDRLAAASPSTRLRSGSAEGSAAPKATVLAQGQACGLSCLSPA